MTLRDRILTELAELGEATSVQLAPRLGEQPGRLTQSLYEMRKTGMVKEVRRIHGGQHGGRMLVVWACGERPKVRAFNFNELMRHWPYCGVACH